MTPVSLHAKRSPLSFHDPSLSVSARTKASQKLRSDQGFTSIYCNVNFMANCIHTSYILYTYIYIYLLEAHIYVIDILFVCIYIHIIDIYIYILQFQRGFVQLDMGSCLAQEYHTAPNAQVRFLWLCKASKEYAGNLRTLAEYIFQEISNRIKGQLDVP